MKEIKYHNKILNNRQKKLFTKLEILKEEDFYLAGGTGLALQLGHRTSADFDFYISSSFDANNILSKINKEISVVKIVQIEKDTLILNCDGIIVSFFTYPYPLLKPLKDLGIIYVASLEDISAMKLIAIIQRGAKRDFIDMYYLIKRIGLNRIFEFSKKKYKDFNPYLALQSLVYFEDAEKEKISSRKIRLSENVEWKDIKKYITEEVRKINWQK